MKKRPRAFIGIFFTDQEDAIKKAQEMRRFHHWQIDYAVVKIKNGWLVLSENALKQAGYVLPK